MIWPKEISFDELDKKVSGWCKAHFLGDPPIDAQLWRSWENDKWNAVDILHEADLAAH